MSIAGCDTSAAEAAIEAWVSCKPQGYMLDEQRLPELLPLVALKVPNTSPELYNRMLEELFVGQQGSTPVFWTLLKPRAGKIHFLSFWKAFSKAVHMASDVSEEVLLSELETLRDRVLQILETTSENGRPVSSEELFTSPEVAISVSALSEEVHRAASMSAHPCFWQEAAASLSQHLKVPKLNIEEVSCLLLLWLNECVHWEHMMASPSEPDDINLIAQGQCFNPFKEAWDMAAHFGSLGAISASSKSISPTEHSAPRIKHKVCIHVYDVSQAEGIQKLNKVLAHASSPLKLGGVFHAGVEVNGLEWSFAYQPHATRYGVESFHPKSHPNHHFRQTIMMGSTECSEEEIAKIIADMVEEYPGNDYDLLRRNCCHFADELCQRLGVGCIPSWIYRLARVGAGVATMLQAAQSVKDKVIDNLNYAKYEPTYGDFHMTETELINFKELRTRIHQNPPDLRMLREADFEME